MMALLEALLALLGLFTVIVAGGVAFAVWLDDAGAESASDPYRGGLDASARITAAGWEAERELFRAALQAKPRQQEEG